MAFNGYYFSFNGVPCTEYGLMLYDISSKSSDSTNDLSSYTEIIEDRIARRYTPLYYGTITNKPLEFTMTFGADINAIDKGEYLDRWDLDAIAQWLTAHNGYKWLEITQPDMEMFRYKCFITDLKHIDVANLPWAFSCKVVCDSPFAYQYPETFKYAVVGNVEVDLLNKSSYRGLYKPKIIISLTRGGSFSICNTTDNNKTMQLSGMPNSALTLNIDCENEIITCNTLSNPYQYFNFNFLRLCKGNNHLLISGNGTVDIVCEFPISIGG